MRYLLIQCPDETAELSSDDDADVEGSAAARAREARGTPDRQDRDVRAATALAAMSQTWTRQAPALPRGVRAGALGRSSPWWRVDIGADQVKQPQLMTT
jgi:hypothetical protein